MYNGFTVTESRAQTAVKGNLSYLCLCAQRHTAQLREELQKLPCPEGLDPDVDDPDERCSAMTSIEDTLLHEQVKPSSSKDLPSDFKL